MKILITDLNTEIHKDLEKKSAGSGVELDIYKTANDITDQSWNKAHGIITYRCSKNVMDAISKIKNTKIVVRGGVGFDGLDLDKLGQKGIAVCTVPDYGTTEVADHAIGLMLMMRRGFDQYDKLMRLNASDNWRYIISPCLDRIRGKTFGVLGLGRIGNAAAKRASSFDMDVVFYDPYLPDGAELSYGYKRVNNLKELFEISDTISIHCPLDEKTEGIINKSILSHAKKSLLLINTARGKIINLEDLYHALKDNIISGAALDVLPIEPPSNSEPLIKAYMNNESWLTGRFTLTPHAAYYSPPGLEDLRSKAVKTVVEYIKNGNLRNCQNIKYLNLG
ncbi:MAG: C-terminal binding protein [Candidatus Puniceispirillales bacterium]